MGVDKIVCGDCQAFFPLSRMESFLHHKSTSCGLDQLECSYCSKSFNSLWSLVDHVQYQHDTRIISEAAEEEGCCDAARCKPRKMDRFCCSTETSVADAAIQTCQDPLGVRGCEKRLRRSAAKSTDENGRMCCDREECGVSVMPGTHENLKKCCVGVLPKKRKRHIETKHLQAFKLKKKAMERVRGSPPEGKQPPVPTTLEGQPVSNLVADKLSSFNVTSDGQDVDEIISSITGIQDTQPPTAAAAAERPVATDNSDLIIDEDGEATDSNTNLILDSLMNHFAKTPDSLPFISSFLPSPMNPVINLFPPSVPNGEMAAASSTIPFSSSVLDEESPNENKAQKKRKYPTSKPFKCNVCDRSFNQRIHLKKHESKHTGIKPYKCDKCDYATVERSHLRVHMRTHTGEKPYKCEYCDYATAQNSTLKIHLRRHHRDANAVDEVLDGL